MCFLNWLAPVRELKIENRKLKVLNSKIEIVNLKKYNMGRWARRGPHLLDKPTPRRDRGPIRELSCITVLYIIICNFSNLIQSTGGKQIYCKRMGWMGPLPTREILPKTVRAFV